MIVSAGYRKRGFDAYGGKILRKEDMHYWMDRSARTDPRGVALGLDREVEEVEPDFFDLLPTIDSIWIYNPSCKIHMTEKTVNLFRANRVVLRGVYDSTAEKLAREYHLCFLHLDVELASVGDYFRQGNDTITLRFRDDGSVYVHQDCRCQGISAGNTGGGEVSFDIPENFYKTMKAKDLAEKCWGSCRGEITKNGVYARFVNKAKKKNGFLLDFRKADAPGKSETEA